MFWIVYFVLAVSAVFCYECNKGKKETHYFSEYRINLVCHEEQNRMKKMEASIGENENWISYSLFPTGLVLFENNKNDNEEIQLIRNFHRQFVVEEKIERKNANNEEIINIENLRRDSNGEVSILDFGAVADGVTDNYQAFSDAIAYAEEHKVIINIPGNKNAYLVDRMIYINSNTVFVGEIDESKDWDDPSRYKSIIYMPPRDHDSLTNMFYTNSNDKISNIVFKNLYLKSENTYPGRGFELGSLVSNIQCMYFLGITDLRIEDVFVEDMIVGLKMGYAKDLYLAEGFYNSGIYVRHFKTLRNRMGVLFSETENFVMVDSTLDADGGWDQRLHSIYIDGATKNLYFENVNFVNAPGGGVHIYTAYDYKHGTYNSYFKNCKFENLKVGSHVYSDAHDIVFDGIISRNTSTIFEIIGSHDVFINDIQASEIKSISKPVLDAQNSQNIIFQNIEIDLKDYSGNLFVFHSSEDISVLNSNFYNMDVHILYLQDYASGKNFLFEDNVFQWPEVSGHRCGIRGSDQDLTFRRNYFINSGSSSPIAMYTASIATVRAVDNYIKGFNILDNNVRGINTIKLD